MYLPIIFIASAGLVMSGCSTTTQRCPIDQDGYPSCVSMSEVFEHAYNDDGDNLSVVPKNEESDSESSEDSAKEPSVSRNVIYRNLAPVQEHPYKAKPVYVPEKVHRTWFAPWTDSNQNLHSAEQVYFTTKGYWNYGTLKATGTIGQGMMEPLAPDDLGFTPDYSSEKSATKVRPEITVFGENK